MSTTTVVYFPPPDDWRERTTFIKKVSDNVRQRLRKEKHLRKDKRLGFEAIFDDEVKNVIFGLEEDRAFLKSMVGKWVNPYSRTKLEATGQIWLIELEIFWAQADEADGRTLAPNKQPDLFP